MLTSALLMATIGLPLSLGLLARNPFNIAAISAALTWLAGVLPGIYFHSSGSIPSYSWRNFVFVGGPLSNEKQSLETLVLLSLLATAFTVGAYAAHLASHTRHADGPVIKAPPRETSGLATMIMAALWVVAAAYFFMMSGWNLTAFLLPVPETYRPSGYLETIFIMMPLAIVLKRYWVVGRLDRQCYVWIVIAIVAAFSRNQRRDFITMALFLVGMVTVVGELRRSPRVDRRPAAHGRLAWKPIAGLSILACGAALVPLLWYSRVYFTSAARGQALDPTQIRGFGELLLGSPATGYPSLGLIRQFVAESGVQLAHLPTYVGSMAIPRAMWPDKPSDLDTVLQLHYRLQENPSSFWFGELYFSMGQFAVPAALVLSLLLFRIAHSSNASRSLLTRSIGLVIFMQSVTFFKNGFSTFLINALMMCAFILFAWFFPAGANRRVRSDPVVPRHPRQNFSPLLARGGAEGA